MPSWIKPTAGQWSAHPHGALSPTTDPQKWAALLDAAQHWALRLETCQQARADASKAVADSADWPALSWEIHQRTDFYRARPWLKRVVA